LFIKDVECLLRDLYGDFGDDVIKVISNAIFNIAQEFLRYARNDLWLEYQSAVDIDYCCGIGVSEEIGISGNDHRAAQKGVAHLRGRACQFRAKPETFGFYTARFLKEFESKLCHGSSEQNTAATNDVIDFAAERNKRGPRHHGPCT